MTLDEFLGRLRVEHRSEQGNSKCRCPAHDDKNGSLEVKVGITRPGTKYPGLRRIFFNCFAGCDYKRVLDAMGLQPDDLYVDPIPEEMKKGQGGREPAKPYVPQGQRAPAAQTAGQRAPAENQEKPKPKKAYMSYEAAFGKVGKIEKIYPYHDKDGKLVFNVLRIWQPPHDDKPADKTFRQCRRVHPDREFPIYAVVNDLPEEQRDLLYRLPDVLAAVRDQKTILLVEGEKDVETLVMRGYEATTCAGGAKKSEDKSSWHPLHSEYLRGADVLILPDHDDPGTNHAKQVATALTGIARRVRVADLQMVWPDIPEKGDVSDMLSALGEDKWYAALERLIKETPDFDDEGRANLLRMHEIYAQVPGYEVYENCLCQSTADGPKRLCNFTAVPCTEIRRDDGEDFTVEYEMEGFSRNGRPYPRCRLTMTEYQNKQMLWLQKYWGLGATVLPGNTTLGKVMYAISEAGYLQVSVKTEYTHTGWRKIAGQWAFLYEGGAIGAEGVSVRLDHGLVRYTLDGGMDIKHRDGAEATWQIREAMAHHVYVPLLGMIFLSPLREFLNIVGATPDVGLYLRGPTGSGKTVASALALSHFGDFRYNLPLPGSFHDSPKSQIVKAYYLKDMPFLIDDFHPSDDKDRRTMESMAQWMLRAISGMGRTTLNSDQTLKSAKSPRSVAIMTGEDLPDVGASGIARMYIVNMRPANHAADFAGDVPKTEKLTDMQEKARKGYLQSSMRGYIKWLAKQADKLPNMLQEDYNRLRLYAVQNAPGQHARLPGALAHIMLGYSSMLRYLRDMDVISDGDMLSEIKAGWEVLLESGKTQAKEMAEDKPTSKFVSIVSALITSGQVRMIDKNKTPPAGVSVCGYKSPEYYYFDPTLIYNEVCKFCRQQGDTFPLGSRQLYKQLLDEGKLEPGSDGNAKRGVNIRGKTQRLIWIKRDLIDGEDATRDQQTGMQIVEEQGVFDT